MWCSRRIRSFSGAATVSKTAGHAVTGPRRPYYAVDPPPRAIVRFIYLGMESMENKYLAAARRADDVDSTSDESMALEGVLLHVYAGMSPVPNVNYHY
jgi:hypothetical protein